MLQDLRDASVFIDTCHLTDYRRTFLLCIWSATALLQTDQALELRVPTRDRHMLNIASAGYRLLQADEALVFWAVSRGWARAAHDPRADSSSAEKGKPLCAHPSDSYSWQAIATISAEQMQRT